MKIFQICNENAIENLLLKDIEPFGDKISFIQQFSSWGGGGSRLSLHSPVEEEQNFFNIFVHFWKHA